MPYIQPKSLSYSPTDNQLLKVQSEDSYVGDKWKISTFSFIDLFSENSYLNFFSKRFFSSKSPIFLIGGPKNVKAKGSDKLGQVRLS
jgi:hypothetical protein